MLTPNGIVKVADAIRSASASMEVRFVDIGGRLRAAVDIIEMLTQTFDRLAEELRGENLRGATHELSLIMTRVAVLTRAHGGEQDAFATLEELTADIQRRVLQMGKAVKGIHMLAMNSRIEAASIGDAGLDFASFATEIGFTLQLAQTSLNHFTHELGGVGRHLRTASASQLAVVQHQGAAAQSIPARLADSVAAINDRGKVVAAAAADVVKRSKEVSKRIGNAVMALQVGDTTRQRLDHVVYALGIIAEVLAAPSDMKLVQHGDCAHLTVQQRRALAILGCRLQGAQLLNAADKFDLDVSRILSSVHDLTLDAQTIMQLGSVAAGASDDRRGTFLGGVEEQVAEVGELLKSLGAARREADEVVVTVTDATTRLVNHTSTLSFLEGDIRLMGLNTSLKCGRLGVVGRPLSIIAQELRAYANQIAVEANAVTSSLERVVAMANTLSGNEQEQRSADLAAVASGMMNSVSRLSAAGESLADALATLASNTDDVARELQAIISQAGVHEELSQVLRKAAADLASVGLKSDSQIAVGTPQADRVLELFLSSYTMDAERIVHDRYSDRKPSAAVFVVSASPGSQDAPADFEDILF